MDLDEMTHEEIKAKAESFGGWYHEIELYPGYTTPSYCSFIRPQWEMIRKVRAALDYKNKVVLDVGTMDGMWAFEAEKLGAIEITTIDIWQGDYFKAQERFQFAHETLGSSVQFEQLSVEELPTWRLEEGPVERSYDIIQCPGVLYHLENPLRALRKMRSVINPDEGRLLLETAIWPTFDYPMARFNSDRGIYDDPTTFWAMNRLCLQAALLLTGWQPITIPELVMAGPTERICLICAPK
jgi:tRNA (mo5U34)-methyltransferase